MMYYVNHLIWNDTIYVLIFNYKETILILQYTILLKVPTDNMIDYLPSTPPVYNLSVFILSIVYQRISIY